MFHQVLLQGHPAGVALVASSTGHSLHSATTSETNFTGLSSFGATCLGSALHFWGKSQDSQFSQGKYQVTGFQGYWPWIIQIECLSFWGPYFGKVSLQKQLGNFCEHEECFSFHQLSFGIFTYKEINLLERPLALVPIFLHGPGIHKLKLYL